MATHDPSRNPGKGTPEDALQHDAIAVLDFGGQYCHLIATKLRLLGVFAEIREPDDPLESFKAYKGFVLSGSHMSAGDAGSGWTEQVLGLGRPVLGLCFGHQQIARHFGGGVEHSRREYGAATLHVLKESPLLKGLEARELVWMSHGDSVTRLPEGFAELGFSTGGASSSQHRNAAIADESRRIYGLQFHPEVDDTPCGTTLLRNFVLDICGAEADWRVGDQIEERVAALKAQVRGRDVLLLVSGGVDSTVAAKLFERALGIERLRLLHIDNGLMRKDESRRVVADLEAMGLGPALHAIDASHEFLKALEGLTDPEAKRGAIGLTFVRVFEREALALGIGAALLGQGTIYPDTIETGGSKRADIIKTHHNRIPLIDQMLKEGKVIEPLSDLYKTEVRALGRALGIADRMLERHPFPGPGLGIRLAAATEASDDFDNDRLSSEIREGLAGTGLRGIPLPVRSVGVKGDLRSYEHPALLSGVMPAWERLVAIATGLIKQVKGLNRCLYELGSGQPRRARLVPATVTPERLELLRELDAIVMDALAGAGLMRSIWQCPTVLVPVELDGRGRELVVLRPVYSERAMTARPAWLGDKLASELSERLRAYEEVSGVAIDVTTKPPATIEWE